MTEVTEAKVQRTAINLVRLGLRVCGRCSEYEAELLMGRDHVMTNFVRSAKEF